ncbi:MAG TPA: hypothetical protein PLQ03_06545 [Brevundimonas sp.]|uniref:hypothetical protein n=1 Tax=Brevundimonas sp. TaxID=1871086 RepID=UPI00260B489D|nr:hypothetical protein [Brevundimonas sp.]HRO33056.1 hypothetical protein [Brevundimonas sp.]
MILESAVALALTTATPQSIGTDMADLRRRIEALRQASEQPAPPPGPGILHTASDFQRAARRALLGRLRDPDSARFRNVRRLPAPNGQVFCGEINTRNGFGGMTGFHRFQAYAGADGRTYIEFDDAEDRLRRTYFQTGWARDCSGDGHPVTF